MLNTKTSNNPLKDILADLQLFQQTNYCYNYIKKNIQMVKKLRYCILLK